MTTERLLAIWSNTFLFMVLAGVLVGGNYWLNWYFLNYSLFGFTFFEIDIRMYGIVFFEVMFVLVTIWEKFGGRENAD